MMVDLEDGDASSPKTTHPDLTIEYPISKADGGASGAITPRTLPIEHQLQPQPQARPEDEEATQGTNADGNSAPKQSKNQLRKLKRQQQWEDRKEDRKRKRKVKRLEKSARRREDAEAAKAAGIDPTSTRPEPTKTKALVPVGIIIDCDFEQYMLPQEIMSLSSQLVRCYSDNKKAEYRVHLYLSGIKGALRDRFEGPLLGHYRNWQGVHILEEDFLAAAKMADAELRGQGGGAVIDLLSAPPPEQAGAETEATQPIRIEPESVRPEYNSVVYLTSDSPNTLTRLEPYTSYIIGGLVDRNREKGLCYRRAREAGLRTARLPIGEFMALATRHVLTTNQVGEIMLHWLACGDWGEAFVKVIPSRKGGKLKEALNGEENTETQGDIGENEVSGNVAVDDRLQGLSGVTEDDDDGQEQDKNPESG